ncbi:cobalt ECF transporter T component CbiQ [Chachezhania sediminis]|uniref:cobalt ECF transporter T component CbiQ n=1 Tax=Chachezhania sediminis TaxID=2599291 RepID=UPI00131C0A84|nr:cobalt ECF transporter T component CbiQ [Chachezhania sediminis]
MTHVLTGAETEAGARHLPGLSDRDPRLRIVLAVAFAITVVSLSDLRVLVVALACAGCLVPLSGLPVGLTLRRMLAMDGFVIAMLLLLPFSVPGTPLFSVWGLTASREGLVHAVEIGLTANAAVLALLTLVGGMEPVTVGHALHALKVPERLVHLMMFTIRYVDVLRDETQRLRVAMKVRGFRPGTNWHTYRSYGYLVGMLLVRSVERSERILAAMKCRGFSGRLVLLEQPRMRAGDWVFAALAASVMLALLAANVWLVHDPA